MLKAWRGPSLPRFDRPTAWRPVDYRAVILEPATKLPQPLAQTLMHALSLNEELIIAYQPQEGYEDCPWYQEIPKVRTVTPYISHNNKEQVFTPKVFRTLAKETRQSIPSLAACELELDLEMPGGSRQTRRLKTTALLLDDVSIAVTQDSNLQVKELAEHIVRSYFDSDTCGSVYDKELADFQKLATHDATLALKGPLEAERSHVDRILRDNFPAFFRYNRNVSIHVHKGVLTLDMTTLKDESTETGSPDTKAPTASKE